MLTNLQFHFLLLLETRNLANFCCYFFSPIFSGILLNAFSVSREFLVRRLVLFGGMIRVPKRQRNFKQVLSLLWHLPVSSSTMHNIAFPIVSPYRVRRKRTDCNAGKLIPFLQVKPSPVKPLRHLHENDPTVLIQSAEELQPAMSNLHSSTSRRKQNIHLPCKVIKTTQVTVIITNVNMRRKIAIK